MVRCNFSADVGLSRRQANGAAVDVPADVGGTAELEEVGGQARCVALVGSVWLMQLHG